MQAERRVVTILFCDVKGSTSAAEQLDPEDWREIMNGAFEHMIRPVYQYEGTVTRLMGDVILDPIEAIQSGLVQVNDFDSLATFGQLFPTS